MRRRRRVFGVDIPGAFGAPLGDNEDAELGRALLNEPRGPARGEELREDENDWGSMVRVTGLGLKVTLREVFGRAVSVRTLSCLNRGARSEVELLGAVGLPGSRGDESIVGSDESQGRESGEERVRRRHKRLSTVTGAQGNAVRYTS